MQFKGFKSNVPQPASTPEPSPVVAPDWGVSIGADTTNDLNPASSIFDVQDEGFMGGEVPMENSGVATRNVLNSDVKVVGTLRFTDDLLVDGSVQGQIESDGILTVGVNAIIQAGEKSKTAVQTRSAIIHGRVTGDVVVTDRVELTSTAELAGDIVASKISIQDGAVFVGYCKVGNPSMAPVEPAPAATGKKGKAATKSASDNLLD